MKVYFDLVEYGVTNYSHVFGSISATTLALINTCKYVQKDSRGQYVWTAISYDSEGNVYFIKEYDSK